MNEVAYEIDKEFWGDHLEVNTELVIQQHAEDDYMAQWAKRLSPRCRALLLEQLDIDDDDLKIAEERDAILEERDELLPFLLVDEAAKGKLTYAMVEVARAKLSEAELDACLRNGKEDNFDRNAIMWRLFLEDRDNLDLVFHLDRTQRKGFARMVIDDLPDLDEAADVDEFFDRDNIQKILDAYEEDKTTLRQSYCAALLHEDGGNYQLFIKRDNKSSFVSHGAKNTFGFEPEWIVLEFTPDLHRLLICSDTPNVPTELANRIAGEYFGEKVEYENESIETDEGVVADFLRSLLDDPNKLPLVELVTKNCGLDGSPQLRLNNQEDESLAPSIANFAASFGSPINEVEDIESIKVHVFKKRVKMIFEQNGDDERYVVRYADQPLNGKQRREFEEMMLEEHEITVLSTEKKRRES